jgi:hypothetical protein
MPRFDKQSTNGERDLRAASNEASVESRRKPEDKEEIRIDTSLNAQHKPLDGFQALSRQCKHFAVYISISLML